MEKTATNISIMERMATSWSARNDFGAAHGDGGRATMTTAKPNAAIYATTDKGQDVSGELAPLREWTERLGYEPATFSELDQIIKGVRSHAVQAVAISKLGQLGRSLAHLLRTLGEFELTGVRLLVHDMGLDTSTPRGKLFFSMVGAFAELEKELVAERARDRPGYAQTHRTRSGRGIGRPRAEINVWTILNTASRRDCPTVTAQARRLGVGRATLYRRMAEGGYCWEQDVGWVLSDEATKPSLGKGSGCP